ncbi:kinase-like domain-containing protein [Trametes polyzona]|nr:kinase-like domain-containing protein [Trametes polyzona]
MSQILRRTLLRLHSWLLSRFRSGKQCSTVDHQHTWADYEEPLARYDPSNGGYSSVSIGDILGEQYTVLRKLGWGEYSTVWLVRRNMQTSTDLRSSTLQVLKVMNKDATFAQGTLFHEAEFLRRIHSQNPAHPGYCHVVQMFDGFTEEDDGEGRHLCLVMEPMLEDLRLFAQRWSNCSFSPPLLRLVGRQVALGLQYLHEECNIIHTDLKPSNIMIAPPGDPDDFITSYLSRDKDPIESCTERAPHGPLVTRVRTLPIPHPDMNPGVDLFAFDTWRGFQVKIGDVGVSCWADKVDEHYTDQIQSPSLRAPEVALGAGWGKPADIWSFGCTLWELYVGEPLFDPSIKAISVPTCHVMEFGDYPSPLIQRGKYRNFFFDLDGTMKYPPPGRASFEDPIREKGQDDAELFIDFLHKTFALDPDERATCGSLLDHQWLNPSGCRKQSHTRLLR